QYACSLVAYDPSTLATLWEMHMQPGCDVYSPLYSGLFQAEGQIVFRMSDRIFLLSPPPSAPGYAVTAALPAAKALLELRTSYGDLSTITAVSPQDFLPFTGLISVGAFGFRDGPTRSFLTTSTPFLLLLTPDSTPNPGTYSGTL